MNKKQAKQYVATKLLVERDLNLKGSDTHKVNRIKGMAINNGMRLINAFLDQYENDEDEVKVEELLATIAFKKSNAAIMADGFLTLSSEALLSEKLAESLMMGELEEVETLGEMEVYLDKYLSK